MTPAALWALLMDAMPVLGVLCGVLVLVLGKKFVRHTRCDEHRQSILSVLSGTDNRRKELEKAIQGLPTAKDLDAMQRGVSQLVMEVSVLRESLRGQKELFQRLESQVDRIDSFMKGVSR